MDYFTSLPDDIIIKINDYIPNDKDFKSPTSQCVNRLIDFYSGDVCFEACIRALYIIVEGEPFYKYVLRVNKNERKVLKHLNIPFSHGPFIFTPDSDYESEGDE